jgi:hypothetical protein
MIRLHIDQLKFALAWQANRSTLAAIKMAGVGNTLYMYHGFTVVSSIVHHVLDSDSDSDSSSSSCWCKRASGGSALRVTLRAFAAYVTETRSCIIHVARKSVNAQDKDTFNYATTMVSEKEINFRTRC